jgi:hypothetical protein
MAKKQLHTDLQNLPACAAEFIRQVLRKMHYRRKVQQEVQAELAAHFEDELKDCATDEDKEQKAQQLITEFGDVKLLAVLLRRAKKRCRPLWRTVVARTFQTVGVLILWFIVYVIWFLTGKPVITTDYVAELNSMVRPVADESLNAAPLYLKAVDLYMELSDDFLLFYAQNQKAIVDEEFTGFADLPSKIDKVVSNKNLWHYQEKRQDVQGEVYAMFYKLLQKKYDELTAEQRNIAQRWIQEQNDALELIIEGSRRPYYWRTYESRGENASEMVRVPLPHLLEFRTLAYSLRWRAQLRAEQGQYKDAFDDMKSCYRLGQHLRGDKFFIEQLLGIAIEAIALQTFRDVLSQYQIDSATLVSLQKDFEQIIAGENFVVSLETEKMILYDEIQRCFTSDRFGKGHLYIPRFRKIKDIYSNYEKAGVEPFILDLVYSVQFLFGHPNKEETLESTNELYDYWEQLCRKTTAQIHEESDAIDNKLKELLNGNVFLGILTPAFKRVIEISNRLPTEVGAALTMIALLRYEHDTNEYPQNLNQLVTSGYLKQLPMDSFSDKPLVYRRTDDSFILYSLGRNFKDDDGQCFKDKKGIPILWANYGDAVFWPVLEAEVKQ